MCAFEHMEVKRNKPIDTKPLEGSQPHWLRGSLYECSIHLEPLASSCFGRLVTLTTNHQGR